MSKEEIGKLNKLNVVFGVVLTLGFFVGFVGLFYASDRVMMSRVSAAESHEFKTVYSGKYQLSDTVFEFLKEDRKYAIYEDSAAGVLNAHIDGIAKEMVISLLDSDGTLKSYSEDDKNELSLIYEDSERFVLQDVDTGVQYVILRNFDDYYVRRNEDGSLYMEVD